MTFLRDQLYAVNPVNEDIWFSTFLRHDAKSFPLSQVEPVEDSAYIEIRIVLHSILSETDTPSWQALFVYTEFDEGRVV